MDVIGLGPEEGCKIGNAFVLCLCLYARVQAVSRQALFVEESALPPERTRHTLVIFEERNANFTMFSSSLNVLPPAAGRHRIVCGTVAS